MNVENVRMMTTEIACEYTGMGKTALREFGERIGARRKFGKSLRFDKKVFDEYFDKLKASEEAK